MVDEAELVSLALLPLTIVGFVLLLDAAPSRPEALVDYLRRAASFQSPVLLASTLVSVTWKAVVQSVGLAEAHDVSHRLSLALALIVGAVGWVVTAV